MNSQEENKMIEQAQDTDMKTSPRSETKTKTSPRSDTNTNSNSNKEVDHSVAIQAQESVESYRNRERDHQKKLQQQQQSSNSGSTNNSGSQKQITVCVRGRPLSELEDQNKAKTTVISENVSDKHEFEAVSFTSAQGDQAIALYHHELMQGKKFGVNRGSVSGNVTTKKCQFDRVFGHEVKNEEIYEGVVQPLVKEFMNTSVSQTQSNTCYTIIAYGQTGSGKTFTQVGIQDFIVRDLAQNSSKMTPSSLTLAFFENQGDKIFDLLNERKNLTMREDGEGKIHVAELTRESIDVKLDTSDQASQFDESQISQLIKKANALRASKPTSKNPHSSRSHAVCEFQISYTDNQSKNTITNTFRVVDLAGNERREDLEDHSVEHIDEMRDINWSLGCLKECIRLQNEANWKQLQQQQKQQQSPRAQAQKETFIPYRRSKLTMLLKECFTSSSGSESNANETNVDKENDANASNQESTQQQNNNQKSVNKTIFIGHIAPMNSQTKHTKNTLTYMGELMSLAEAQEQASSGAASKGKGKAGAGVKLVQMPDKWTKARFAKWFSTVEDGRFEKFLESFQINGVTFQHMPKGIQVGGLVPRMQAAGGTEEDAVALAGLFQQEIAKAKRSNSKAQAQAKAQPQQSASTGAAGGAADAEKAMEVLN